MLQKASKNSSVNPERKPKRGQGRLPRRVPVAVIDIGSNSVRQVIYEGLTRAPAVLFNEKVLCGLGEGIHESGKLNEQAVERALRALRRFKLLQESAGVGAVHIIATAAAREASNGPRFIEEVERLSGHPVEVLTGSMEAHYAALGVRSGFHKPSGIVGDLGGGSLELVDVNGPQGSGITLPLGGLRLREMSEGSMSKARAITRDAFAANPVFWGKGNRDFLAVGGTWRSLARLHIAQKKYPLPAVHEYTVEAEAFDQFCERVVKDVTKVRGIQVVSKNRRELLPYGATVMREVIRKLKPERIITSSLGVREGFLFSRLSSAERRADSLLAAAKDLSLLRARSPEHCVDLANWTSMAFSVMGIDETENDMRHRIAACFLADIGWRAHPDFRAQQAVEIIANAGFVGISHEGRAYLAIASHHRYKGLSGKAGEPSIVGLASADARGKARLLAAMFRVLYLFSASNPGVLPKITMRRVGEKEFEIILPLEMADLIGERPEERVRQLSSEAGVQFSIVVAEAPTQSQ